jgi:hypothetical protein
VNQRTMWAKHATLVKYHKMVSSILLRGCAIGRRVKPQKTSKLTLSVIHATQ